MIASICSEPKILEIMRIINIFISIIRIVVPLILIFVLIFKFVKAILSGNEDGLKKASNNAPYNIIAAVVIFLIPNFISLIVKATFPSNDYNNCLSVKSIDEISILYVNKMDNLIKNVKKSLDVNDYSNAQNYLANIKDESKKIEYQKELDEIKKQIDEINVIINPPTVTVDQSDIVQLALSYKGQNVGKDCSGFVKMILEKTNYFQDDIRSSGFCDGRSRGSYGMYLKYLEKGRVVWQRNMSAKNPSEAITTFPGACVPGDMIFYSYGTNDCVKHIVIYAGFENGKHMIVDSNMYDNIVRYRPIDEIYRTAIPLGCARPIKNEG